jgi:uncharacterized DUF497 family protein
MYDFSVGSFEEPFISFEWDEDKNRINQEKHGVSFEEARKVFQDTRRIVAFDTDHSDLHELRFLCIGEVDDGILTVRFTERGGKIRIFGAGFWRKQRKAYEEKNR